MALANEGPSLDDIITQVAKDKGIEKSTLLSSLEEAMRTAAKKHFGQERRLEAQYNAEKGVVEISQVISIVEEVVDPLNAVNELTLSQAKQKGLDVEVGDELVFQIFYRDEDATEAKAQDERCGDILGLKTFRRGFGRIAAQTAKQVLRQRTRDVERENVYNEYKDRKNEIVTGIARRLERRNLIVDLGRAEAVLPEREQVPREVYRPGDRVQAYVVDVLRESQGPQIVLSRTAVNLLVKLFEMEVPEISEGVVVIEAAAREPGRRAKIAVSSREQDVDPIGTCVGMKGSRVQAVVQELRGEKIDIVPWDEDPARFVCAALAPAEVSRVIIDESNRAMEIVVPDDQLSLAIGRHGQNVRLAAQLTGWKLDINSETRVKEIREFAAKSLGALPGVNEVLVETLYAHGFRQAKDVAEASPEVLMQIPGIDVEQIETLQKAAVSQRVVDANVQARLEMEQVQAQQEAENRHPDEMRPEERLLRIRGITEQMLTLLAKEGYKAVEDLAKEEDLVRLGSIEGVGIKRARLLKTAAEQYLESESRRRASLDAQREAQAGPGGEEGGVVLENGADKGPEEEV
ncbi:MAG: transcription termination factor NusA [Proteobacteria bacterium]|nr:transcription termination factor NusA [Cystobacterineae bacterium]MCL2314709.1 transcription termination factor NusA [Pseudomonadota bacterium]